MTLRAENPLPRPVNPLLSFASPSLPSLRPPILYPTTGLPLPTRAARIIPVLSSNGRQCLQILRFFPLFVFVHVVANLEIELYLARATILISLKFSNLISSYLVLIQLVRV